MHIRMHAQMRDHIDSSRAVVVYQINIILVQDCGSFLYAQFPDKPYGLSDKIVLSDLESDMAEQL